MEIKITFTKVLRCIFKVLRLLGVAVLPSWIFLTAEPQDCTTATHRLKNNKLPPSRIWDISDEWNSKLSAAVLLFLITDVLQRCC